MHAVSLETGGLLRQPQVRCIDRLPLPGGAGIVWTSSLCHISLTFQFHTHLLSFISGLNESHHHFNSRSLGLVRCWEDIKLWLLFTNGLLTCCLWSMSKECSARMISVLETLVFKIKMVMQAKVCLSVISCSPEGGDIANSYQSS